MYVMNKAKVWKGNGARWQTSKITETQLQMKSFQKDGGINRLCNLQAVTVFYDIFCASVICCAHYRWDVTNYKIWQWMCDLALKGRLAVEQPPLAVCAFHPQRLFQVGCLEMELIIYNVRKQFCYWMWLLCYARHQNKSSHAGAWDCAVLL